MVDLAIDQSNDIYLDPGTNDLALVRGRREDMQRLAQRTRALFFDEIGNTDEVNVVERSKLLVKRVAAGMSPPDGVEGVVGADVYYDPNDNDTLLVKVHYASGDGFSYALNRSPDEAIDG